MLVTAGADGRAWSTQALIDASYQGHTAIIPLLLAAGADIHAEDDRALRDASAYGKLDAVAALLAAGADVHAKDDESLASAARLGYDAVVAQLLRAGADVRSGKYRALKRALRSNYGNVQGKQRALEHLVAAGAATWPQAGDAEDATSSRTRFLAFVNHVVDLERRLEAACERGDAADVDAVLSAPTLAVYLDVETAFSMACSHGHAGIVACLIAAGADVHDGDNDMHGGNYVGPLIEACEAGHLAVVAALVAAGAHPGTLNAALGRNRARRRRPPAVGARWRHALSSSPTAGPGRR